MWHLRALPRHQLPMLGWVASNKAGLNPGEYEKPGPSDVQALSAARHLSACAACQFPCFCTPIPGVDSEASAVALACCSAQPWHSSRGSPQAGGAPPHLLCQSPQVPAAVPSSSPIPPGPSRGVSWARELFAEFLNSGMLSGGERWDQRPEVPGTPWGSLSTWACRGGGGPHPGMGS